MKPEPTRSLARLSIPWLLICVGGSWWLATGVLGSPSPPIAPNRSGVESESSSDPEPASGPTLDATGQLADPRDLLDGYPPFTAVPRVPVLEDHGYYPCSDCHDNESQVANPQIRILEEMHDDIEFDHGGGRFWCLTCHHDTDRDSLTSLEHQPISFDESFLLCGQCHSERQRDFLYGAHGRRVGSWQGDRTVTPCTQCHDAHRPAILPAKPYAPPQPRRGLSRPTDSPHSRPLPWERREPKAQHEESSDDGGR